MERHDIYSRDGRLCLAGGDDKLLALETVVERSGFLPHVLARWAASGKSKERFKVDELIEVAVRVPHGVFTMKLHLKKLKRCQRGGLRQ